MQSVSRLFCYFTEYFVTKAQINFSAIFYCVDADTKITKQVPILCYLLHITTQTSETMDKKYINLPIFRCRVESHQPRTIHYEATSYIVGETNNFKAILSCMDDQSMPLCLQHIRTV